MKFSVEISVTIRSFDVSRSLGKNADEIQLRGAETGAFNSVAGTKRAALDEAFKAAVEYTDRLCIPLADEAKA